MPSTPATHPSHLWDFSLAYYARPRVADTCLELQDVHGANVNLVLWCIWLEQRGLRLDSAHLHSAGERIRQWDEHYVKPLRQLRRRMKAEFGVTDAGIEQLRSQIKAAELLAEKQLQADLELEVQSWHPLNNTCPPVPGDNLRLYLRQLKLAEDAIELYLHLLQV